METLSQTRNPPDILTHQDSDSFIETPISNPQNINLQHPSHQIPLQTVFPLAKQVNDPLSSSTSTEIISHLDTPKLRDEGPTVRFATQIPSPTVSPSPSSEFDKSAPPIRSISLSDFLVGTGAIKPHLEFPTPDPTYFNDPDTGRYGIRCICGRAFSDGVLVQCDRCGFWLHGICVCIARSRGEPFYCPFCTVRVIKCRCGQNRNYNIPIVKCSSCQQWVHKRCANLSFGRLPSQFRCPACQGDTFPFPTLTLQTNTNRNNYIECSRSELLQPIPPGSFRNYIVTDLQKTELNFNDTISRYFSTFAYPIFTLNHEFWKVFVDSMSMLLRCDRSMIFRALDQYAEVFLYSTAKARSDPSLEPIEFEYSESITNYVCSEYDAPVFQQQPTPHELILQADNFICTKDELNEGDFICDLPGFLCHTDELDANNGIPKTVLSVTDTNLVIDMDGSSVTFAPNLKRSFHFNTIVKIYKIGTIPRVGLFATRFKGPLNEDRNKKGFALRQGEMLRLPFDGDLPYPVTRCEWKDKVKPKPKPPLAKTPKKSKQKKMTCDVHLSLLSAFCEDIIPPLPFNIVERRH